MKLKLNQLFLKSLLIFSISLHVSCIMKQIQPSPEADQSFLEMTKSHGYPVWSKFIDTADGYTLNIFRIPGPRGESLSQSIINSSTREPVLMLHGILSSSEGFIMNGPLIAPVYQIVDTGRYDAWLLNVRGNSYSKQHNFYNSKSDKQYWQFGFEEMANYDLTAAVDYVLRVTQKKQLTIIGFSQGTTITFASLAMNNEFYKDKVKAFIYQIYQNFTKYNYVIYQQLIQLIRQMQKIHYQLN